MQSSAKFKSVFVRPDRTLGEHASHKLLIEELKRMRGLGADPGSKYFIKGGSVRTEENTDMIDGYWLLCAEF